MALANITNWLQIVAFPLWGAHCTWGRTRWLQGKSIDARRPETRDQTRDTLNAVLMFVWALTRSRCFWAQPIHTYIHRSSGLWVGERRWNWINPNHYSHCSTSWVQTMISLDHVTDQYYTHDHSLYIARPTASLNNWSNLKPIIISKTHNNIQTDQYNSVRIKLIGVCGQ